MIRPQWVGTKSVYPEWLRRVTTVIPTVISAIGEFYRTISSGVIYRIGTIKKELKDGKI